MTYDCLLEREAWLGGGIPWAGVLRRGDAAPYIYIYMYIYVCLSHGEGGPGPQVRKRFWHTRLFFLSSRLEQLVGLGVEADPVGMSFASQAGLCKVTDRLYVAF